MIESLGRDIGTGGDAAGPGGGDEGHNILLRPIGGGGEVVGSAG